MRILPSILVMLLPVLAAAEPVEMTPELRKLFRRDGELSTSNAKDNAHECTRTVRRAIKRAGTTWGPIRYICTNGIVRNVFADIDSKINREPGQFITKNLGLFDLEGSSTTVTFDGNQGTQLESGAPVLNGGIYRVAHKDGKQMVLEINLLDHEIHSIAIDVRKMK